MKALDSLDHAASLGYPAFHPIGIRDKPKPEPKPIPIPLGSFMNNLIINGRMFNVEIDDLVEKPYIPHKSLL